MAGAYAMREGAATRLAQRKSMRLSDAMLGPMRSQHKMVLGLAAAAVAGLAVEAQYRHEAESDFVVRSYEERHYSDEDLKKYPRPPLPRTNPGSWIVSEDYPEGAIYSEFQGRTGVKVAVDPYGEVSSCTVTAPSGANTLDRKGCVAIETRARFYPALNGHQEPVHGTYSTWVVWQLTE